MMLKDTALGLGERLLQRNEDKLVELVPQLIERVASGSGLPREPADLSWPVDVLEATREFLRCIASGDLDRIRARGGIFETMGLEAARGGMDFDDLARAIRLSAGPIQEQIHRAVLADESDVDSEAVLALLARVLRASEAVVAAARDGYELVALAPQGEDLGRQLAGELFTGSEAVAGLAERLGWKPSGLVCAVITTRAGGVALAGSWPVRPAYYERTDDLVLGLPVAEGSLATSLRPRLEMIAGAVGPAVPLSEYADSLALAQRAAALPGGPVDRVVFADDVLLELACAADPVVVAALRRKYLAEVDELSDDHRGALLRTLHHWLLQWGHRPRTAAALDVHPQTVSGRLHRMRDLLADDLEDAHVRAELLVLLTAEGLA